MTRYSEKFVFPCDIVDSVLAAPHLASETKELLQKHLRYPPNKRPPFGKLGVALPYSLPFERLVNCFRDEEAHAEGFFVLRDRQLLAALCNKRQPISQIARELQKRMDPKKFEAALLPVKLTCTRGVPTRFTPLYAIQTEMSKPMIEPAHSTTKAERSVTMEDLTQEEFDPDDNVYQIIGFLVAGDRNYNEGSATGLGYVSLNALAEATRVSTRVEVGFRNLHSFEYRIGSLSVVF